MQISGRDGAYNSLLAALSEVRGALYIGGGVAASVAGDRLQIA